MSVEPKIYVPNADTPTYWVDGCSVVHSPWSDRTWTCASEEAARELALRSHRAFLAACQYAKECAAKHNALRVVTEHDTNGMPTFCVKRHSPHRIYTARQPGSTQPDWRAPMRRR